MEMKWKLEMETGNRKLETEMETQLLHCCIPSEIQVESSRVKQSHVEP